MLTRPLLPLVLCLVESVTIPLVSGFQSEILTDLSASYAPYTVECPKDTQLVRPADQLYARELAYILDKQNVRSGHLQNFLDRNGLGGIVDASAAKLGLAFSGGGYRAFIAAAGNLAALDERTEGGTRPGHVGGLLQSAAYITGLSGGALTLSSMYLNDFANTIDLRDDPEVWGHFFPAFDLSSLGSLRDRFDKPSYQDDEALVKYQAAFTLEALLDIPKSVASKARAGYPVSFTDLVGRWLSQNMIRNHTQRINGRWSDIRNFDYFTSLNTSVPFPIIVTTEKAYRKSASSQGSYTPLAQFEFTPFELGTWNPPLKAFSSLEYLGSELWNGKPVSETCVKGYDSAGFVFATAANFMAASSVDRMAILITALENLGLLDLGPGVGSLRNRALYSPNPFKGYNPDLGSIDLSGADTLELADGCFDGQGTPLEPLLRPERELDVIIAFDNNEAHDGWPDLSSLGATHKKFADWKFGIDMPLIPPEVGTRNFHKPLFLGCDLQSDYPKMHQPNHHHPLIVYISDAPYSSDTAPMDFRYIGYTRQMMLNTMLNSYNVATRGNCTVDPEWSQCLACAIIKRELDRQTKKYPEICSGCFLRYCFSDL